MLGLLKEFFQGLKHSSEKKRILENFFSLTFLQGASYILPLITLPYLVRVLGPEKFGLIAFAQAFVQYFVIVTDYGFNLSATREISIHRDDKQAVSRIVSSVFAAKAVFLTACAAVLAAVLLTVPKFRDDWLIYVFSFGLVFDNVLFPVWFFQGVEKMKYITIRNVTAKLIFTICIFVFIRTQDDYLKVPLINTLGMLTVGILGLIPVFTSFGVRFIRPSPQDVFTQLARGWHIFVSRLSISLYTNTNTFVLGLYLNNTVVGYYAAAEKIVRMFTLMFEPLFRSVYPHIVKKAADSTDRARQTLRKVFKVSFSASLVTFALFFAFAGVVVRLLLGPQYAPSLPIIRALSPLLVVVPAAYVLANLGLLPFKMDRQFLWIYVFGGLINIAFLFIFLGLLQLKGLGAAVSCVLTELTLTILMWRALKKKQLNFVL